MPIWLKILNIAILLLICSVFLNGCVIPWPHFKQTSKPICGYIAAQDPNVPIENAHIEIYYPDKGFRETLTDKYGFFSFPKKIRFHWGVLFGVALNHSLPFDCYVNGFTELKVEADGYNKLSIYPEYVKNIRDHFPNPNELYLDFKNTECPKIILEKREGK